MKLVRLFEAVPLRVGLCSARNRTAENPRSPVT